MKFTDEQIESSVANETEGVKRLGRDLRKASETMSLAEARYLVGAYYMMQDNRLRSDAQLKAMGEQGEPHGVLNWLSEQHNTMEAQLKAALDRYSSADPLGAWARSNPGVGPVIAAGLLAHVDVTKATTAGALWRFAGLDPTQEWRSRLRTHALVAEALGLETKTLPLEDRVDYEDVIRVANVFNLRPESVRDRMDGSFTVGKLASVVGKRPWNAELKVICFHLGECFKFVCNKEDAYYGRVYSRRKELEIANNESGLYAERAAAVLKAKNIGKETTAYKFYSNGMLPPAHIQRRSQRYAVKLFLAHYLEVGRRQKGLPVPMPYPISHLGHVHYIPPPGEKKAAGGSS